MRRLILYSIIALVFISCETSRVLYNDPQEIGFTALAGNVTKADLAETHSSMGVFSYFTNTDNLYFDDTKFILSGEGNKWSGNQYWPLGAPVDLDFVVYAPYKNDVLSNDGATYATAYYNRHTNILTIHVPYKTPNNPKGQADYLYGERIYTGDVTSYSETGIPVRLRHAMAKITVKITSSLSDVYEYVGITMYSTRQAGYFEIDYNTDPATCTAENGSGGYNHEFTGVEKGTILTQDISDAGSFWVFPSKQQTLEIKYKMVNFDSVVFTKTIDLSIGSDPWEPGKHYIYTIIMNPVKISIVPTVDEMDAVYKEGLSL